MDFFHQNLFKRRSFNFYMEEENKNNEENKEESGKEESGKETLETTLKKNPWILSTVVLGILVLVLLVGSFSDGFGLTGNVISSNHAGNAVVDFANIRTGGGVSLSGVEDIGSLYQVNVLFQGQELPLYITKDGKNLVQAVVSLDIAIEQAKRIQQQESFEDQNAGNTSSTLIVENNRSN